MSLIAKATILDAQEMRRIVRRMAGEILENEGPLDELMLVGIRTRGVPLAAWLAAEIAVLEGTASAPAPAPAIGTLDITLYRDDLSLVAPKPVVRESHFDAPIEGRTLVLCDDVLYTGRTVRAAIDALLDYGRPRAVRLAVLVDRGWRELPVHADYVGRKVPTSASEVIKVSFEETDGKSEVQILDRKPEA